MIDILLAEDTHFGVRYVKRAMANWSHDHEITVAKDGQAVLNMLGLGDDPDPQPAHPDLLLLDLNMPRVHGLEVLSKIRDNAATRNMKVIVLTTSDSPFDMDEAGALAVDDYLLKGCNPATMKAAMERVLQVPAAPAA